MNISIFLINFKVN